MKMNHKKTQLSAMMFIQFFIWGSWFVTMGTYLGKTLNFSGVQIGLAYGTAAIASIISPFIVGAIADRFFSANRVMAFLNIVGGALMIWLSTIKDFSLFFPVLFAYTICYMPTTSLANSISMDNLSDPGKEFSRVRLFGSIGWVISGFLLSGLRIEETSIPFLIAGGASLFGAAYALFLPYKAPVKTTEKVSFVKLIGLDAFRLTKDKSFLLLLVFSALICIPLAFYDSFTNLFLNTSGVSHAAAAMSLGQIVEMIFLFAFPFLFLKWKYKKSIMAAVIAWTVMYGFYAYGAYSGNQFLLYAGLPLHGFCFTFFFVTGQLFVDEKAPVSLRNSAQGLIAFATYGVGKYVGTFVAGKVVDQYTVDGVYDWVSIWMVPFVLAAVILVGFVVFFKEDTRKIVLND